MNDVINTKKTLQQKLKAEAPSTKQKFSCVLLFSLIHVACAEIHQSCDTLVVCISSAVFFVFQPKRRKQRKEQSHDKCHVGSCIERFQQIFFITNMLKYVCNAMKLEEDLTKYL